MIRQTHVKRKIGKSLNPDGTYSDDPDVYADMQRIDKVQTLDHDQLITTTLKWRDAPDDDPNVRRNVTEIWLTDPANPPDDPSRPDSYIPIDVPDKINARDNDQGLNLRPNNTADNTRREFVVKRVYHADTNLDDLDDPTVPVASADYVRLEGTEDRDQYADYELPLRFLTKDDGQALPPPAFGAFAGQKALNTLKPIDLDNSQSAAPASDQPPLRFDEYQSLVNVSWGGATEVLDGAVVTHDAIANSFKISLAIAFAEIVNETTAAIVEIGGSRIDSAALSPQGSSIFNFTDSVSFGFYCKPFGWTDGALSGTSQLFFVDDLVITFGTPLPNGMHLLLFSLDVSAGATYHPRDETDDGFGNIARYHGIRYDAKLNVDGVDWTSRLGTSLRGPAGIISPPPDFFDNYPPIDVPPQPIDLAGGGLWIPRNPFSVGPDPGRKDNAYAAARLWTDQAINFADPTVVADFIKDGRLVPAAVSVTKYGTPVYCLDGPPVRFLSNSRGSAGALAKTGDLKKYPAPNQSS